MIRNGTKGRRTRRTKTTLAFVGHMMSFRPILQKWLPKWGYRLEWVSGTRTSWLQSAVSVANDTDGLVISGSETAARAVVRHATVERCRHASPSWSTFAAFESATHGKARFSTWLHDCGLGRLAPQVYDSASRVSKFPVVMKPHLGSSGRGVQIFTHRRALLKATQSVNMSRWMLQEAIHNTTEWGVHFASYRGNVTTLRCVEIRFRTALFVRKRNVKGLKVASWTEPCPFALKEITDRITRASQYHGFGCLGVKFKHQHPKVLEANSRLCGMLVSSSNGILGEFLARFLTLARQESKSGTCTLDV